MNLFDIYFNRAVLTEDENIYTRNIIEQSLLADTKTGNMAIIGN